MPWKLIGLVLLLVLVATFATLNLSNRTDISLGVHVFRDVPIFLSLLVAFLAGLLVMLPFTIGRRERQRPVGAHRAGSRGRRPREVPEPLGDTPVEELPAQIPVRPARKGGKGPAGRKTRAE